MVARIGREAIRASQPPNRRDRLETTNGAVDIMGRDEQENAGSCAGRVATSEAGVFGGQQDVAAVETDDTAAEAAASAASAPSAAAQTLSVEADSLVFDLASEVVYHRSREAYLTGLRRWSMFATVILGAGTVANLAPTLTGIATAIAGGMDLVFDFTGRAAQHAELRASYMRLVEKLAAADYSDPACRATRKKMLRPSAKEAPPFVVAQIIARNQAILSLGRSEQIEHLPRWKRLCAHAFRFEET